MSLLSLAELEKVSSVSYKTLRKKIDESGLEPFTRGGRGKAHLYDSRYALQVAFHPRPSELQLEGCSDELKSEWQRVVSNIKAIFAEVSLEVSKLSDDKKEQERMFEASKHLLGEVSRALDKAARL